MSIQRMRESLQRYLSEVGLPANVYRESAEEDQYVLTVSWKMHLSNEGILCRGIRPWDPEEKRLSSSVIVGTKEEIERLTEIASSKGADVFSKKSIAGGGYIHPSDEFLSLNTATQAEYALHEAWHAKPKKDVFERDIDFFAAHFEEACAHAIGYLGAIDFFKGTEYEKDAIAHYEKNLRLAKLANGFYHELDKIYAFRVSGGRPIPAEQVEMERDEVFQRAMPALGNDLGSPINNAFFVYWDYFVRHFPVIAEGVQGMSIKDAVELLSHEREVQRLVYGL